MSIPSSFPGIRARGADRNRQRARAASLTLAGVFVAGGLLIGASPAFADEPTAPTPAETVPSTSEQQSASAEVVKTWVTDDSSYGPAQIMQFRLTNTGTATTKYFDLQLPEGTQFLDHEGEQALIHCIDGAMPLRPGATITCNAYRILTAEEIQRGTTDPLNVRVVLFGSAGPKIPATISPVSTNGIGQTRALQVTNPHSSVDLNDATYGAVEKMQFDFANTGNMPSGTLHAVAPDGLAYIDDEGEEMLLNCQAGMFPLAPGDKATCTQYRRLSAAEIAAGETTPQALKFRAFGENGPLFDAPAMTATRFVTALAPAAGSAANPAELPAETRGTTAIAFEAASATADLPKSAAVKTPTTSTPGSALPMKTNSNERSALPYTGAPESAPFITGAALLLVTGCGALTIARIRRRMKATAAEATG